MRLIDLGNGLKRFSQERRLGHLTTKIGYTREHGEDTIMFMGLAEYITNNGVGEDLAQINADGDPDRIAWVHPKRIVNSKNLGGNMDVQ
jgi:hypothetical protein